MLESHRVLAACIALILAAAQTFRCTGAERVDAWTRRAGSPGLDARADEFHPEMATHVNAPASSPSAPGIDNLPLSTQALGAFPFFTIPDGYRVSPTAEQTLEFAEAVFWNGHDLT